MSSRQHHHHRDSTAHSLRRQERQVATWTPHDSDSERPPHSMATMQHHTIVEVGPEGSKRHHSSSRRDSAPTVQASSASHKSHGKSSHRERSHSNPVMPSPNPGGSQSQNQAVSTSTLQRQDSHFDPYSLRNLLSMKKKKSSKRSPPTTNEKLEEGKASRPPLQSRSTFATTTSINTLPPSSGQSYYISPEDPSSSIHQHRDREKDREKRKAEGKSIELIKTEFETLKVNEQERARRKEKEWTSDDRMRPGGREHSKDREYRTLDAYGSAVIPVGPQGPQDERILPPTTVGLFHRISEVQRL